MLVVFLLIVVDAKAIQGCNFVARLILKFGYRNLAVNFTSKNVSIHLLQSILHTAKELNIQ